MRVCIYGAGAMGTSFGVRLIGLPQIDSLEFITRNAERVAYLNEYGVTVVGTAKNTAVKALTPEEMYGKYDVVFLATKQRDNQAIAEFLSGYLKEDGALVTLQNGLPEESLANVLGKDRVYGAALSWGAEITSTGEVIVTGNDGFCVGLGAYGAGERLAEIIGILQDRFQLTVGNLAEIRFAKLATNASFSTLSAISGLPFGVIAKRYKRLAYRMIRETFSVARAYGYRKLPLNGHDLFWVFSFCNGALLPVAMKKYRNTRSGMLKDLQCGKRCDVDFVAGAVVSAGEKKGVPTSCLKRAVALVHDVENGLAEIAPESLDLLR